jgi:acetyltransferase-like isoleucine patch superfamily enzyme
MIVTMTRKALRKALEKCCKHPHPEVRKGQLVFEDAVFTEPDRETSVHVSVGAKIDLTGDVCVGAWTMIGDGTHLLTHDHFHEGRDEPLFKVQERKGIQWRSKRIGRDVWLHGCTVLMQVTEIPDGVVVGRGAVLTRNPGPYEIWAGNPARKVGDRREVAPPEGRSS